MNQAFWQAKIWGLLHDPVLKALHNNTGRGGNSFWRDLAVMKEWVDKDWDPESRSGKAFQQIHLADYLASASDRGAIGAISQSLNYCEQGLEVYHLLSAARLKFQLKSDVHQKLLEPGRGEFLNGLEATLLPEFIRTATDQWLWDIRQCFRGDQDPAQEFDNQGDYWRWKGEVTRSGLPARPLFTMGQKATISFGIVIAHHSVPLAIALEQLWDAEKGAKAYRSPTEQSKFLKKNAVQVRVLYGNGNILTCISPFPIFAHWQNLIAVLTTGQDAHALEDLKSQISNLSSQILYSHGSLKIGKA